MKRIDIVYDGRTYSVGGGEVEDLQDQIIAGLTAGPRWLHVNDGEGSPREALLLIAPGTSIALIPIPEGDSAPPAEMGSWTVQAPVSP